MKRSKLIALGIAIVCAAILFGVVLPWLFSAPDTLSVLAGLAVIIILGFVAADRVNQAFFIRAKTNKRKRG